MLVNAAALPLLLLCACMPASAQDDFELVEGDIQVPRGSGREGDALSASSLYRHSQLFPGGQVRYFIDTVTSTGGATPLTADDVRIERAMANWEAKTCLRFTLCASEASCALPFLKFVAGTGCSSPVGAKTTMPNTIYLSSACSLGATVHELGHSFGLMHEQTRRDRDEYVVVNLANVLSGSTGQYSMLTTSTGRSLGPYDYGSIMHYAEDAFGNGGGLTIIAPEAIGQSSGLSAGDVEAIDFMYNGCSAVYARPTCMASVDTTKAHVIPHSKPWNMDFNVMYADSKSVVVTYAGTTAPAGEMAYSEASGSNIGSFSYTELTFTPSAALAGQTFTLSATFTGSDGPVTTCAVTVRVATANVVCFGIDANDANVCSGHGTCVDDVIAPCQCTAGYAGVDCSGTATCPRDYTTTFDRELSWEVFGKNPLTEDSAFFAAGGGSMRAGDVGSPDKGQARLYVADSEPHTVTFRMAIMSGAQDKPSLRLRRGTKTCAVLQRYATGEWGVGGSTLTGVANPQTERFYDVTMELDWAALEYSVAIDGVHVATAAIRSECIGGMDVAIFFGNGWLDEFKMSCTRPDNSIPTPVPATDVPETAVPTATPTAVPTSPPTASPTSAPTAVPTAAPTSMPTAAATVAPTVTPTAVPTPAPTATPILTAAPTAIPTATPTAVPTAAPGVPVTVAPTTVPTASPTAAPTAVPTAAPTALPTATPTSAPTAIPTAAPTAVPTAAPGAPVTVAPTEVPTASPALTAVPTPAPGVVTDAPTGVPTTVPTALPTTTPTAVPTAAPGVITTAAPAATPTTTPTSVPTAIPTATPTAAPTASPTAMPTAAPSAITTATPTAVPTITPTAGPTAAPIVVATAAPVLPTASPTAAPTAVPTVTPSMVPTAIPTATPTAVPTAIPSAVPTMTPTAIPTAVPTSSPSAAPTAVPTAPSTTIPSSVPPTGPASNPTAVPTAGPTATPTAVPTAVPDTLTPGTTASPTTAPTAVPTAVPTTVPDTLTPGTTAAPTAAPTTVPTAVPTAVPDTLTPGTTATPTAAPTDVPTAAPTVATFVPAPVATSVPGAATRSPAFTPQTEGPVETPLPTTAVPASPTPGQRATDEPELSSPVQPSPTAPLVTPAPPSSDNTLLIGILFGSAVFLCLLGLAVYWIVRRKTAHYYTISDFELAHSMNSMNMDAHHVHI